MGNEIACCGSSRLDYSPEEYAAQLALYQAAKFDDTITQNLQYPQMYLCNKRRYLNAHEKFLRVATEPLPYIQLVDFYKDLDELVASRSFNSNEGVTIDDF